MINPFGHVDLDLAFVRSAATQLGGRVVQSPSRWHREFVGAPERLATGPSGQSATDIVIALRRLGR